MPLANPDRFIRVQQLLNLPEISPVLVQSEAWSAVCAALYSAAGRYSINLLQDPEATFSALQNGLKNPLHIDVLALFGSLRDGAKAAHRIDGGVISIDDANRYVGRAKTFVHVMDNL